MSKKTFLLRAQIIKAIRTFFWEKSFLEVETPLLVKHPGTEPYLDLFETRLKVSKKSEPWFLITSPELQMKKLIAAGFPAIFQIGKSFRNGEVGGNKHNPEFTILEWYRTKTDYLGIMQDTEALIQFIAQTVFNKNTIKKMNLINPWEKKTVQALFLEYCHVDLNKMQNQTDFKAWAAKRGYKISNSFSWDDLFFLIFLNEIEPHLGKKRPIFVYDYPATQAALCRISAKNPFWAERFELYIDGLELCNAFSELSDPHETKKRFLTDMKQRKALGKTTYQYDRDFIEALKTPLPACGGNALGVDRLIMLFLNKKEIQDVLFFPYQDL